MVNGKLGPILSNFLPEPNPDGFRLHQDYTYVSIEDHEQAEPDPFSDGVPVEEVFQTPLESLFARMGAKSGLRAYLVQNFPTHHTYVEPFMGSCKILLYKTRRSKIEIINDIDSDMAEFMRYVAFAPELLVQTINSLPVHEAFVLGLRQALAERKLKGLERAAGFYLASQSAFNAKGDYSSYKSSPHVLMDLSIDLDRVVRVAHRLRPPAGSKYKPVDIRSTGYQRIIKSCNKFLPADRYPPGGVFFYMDPPYWKTSGYKTFQGESSFGWDAQKHLSELCYAIHLMGNKFMQTNSAHEDLRKLYLSYKNPDGSCMFTITEVNVRYSMAGAADKRELEKEFVISNYALQDAQVQKGLFTS